MLSLPFPIPFSALLDNRRSYLLRHIQLHSGHFSIQNTPRFGKSPVMAFSIAVHYVVFYAEVQSYRLPRMFPRRLFHKYRDMQIEPRRLPYQARIGKLRASLYFLPLSTLFVKPLI
jgi:hypothetical protein